MEKLELSKIDAARRQLVTAISFYFNWGDVISIHTLAAAARNVLCNLCKHRGITHPLLLDNLLADFVNPGRHKEFWNKVRKSENFFKHADSDPEGSLTFNPEITDYILLEAVCIYTDLTGEHIPEFHAYRGWWMLHHKDYLTEVPEYFLQENYSIRVYYAANQRTQYFTEMLAAIAQQGLSG